MSKPPNKFICRTDGCGEEFEDWDAAQDHADEAAHVVDVWMATNTLVPKGAKQ